MWKAPSLLPKRAAVKVISQNPSKGERLVFLCITMKNVYNKLALLWGEAQKKIAYSYLKVT